MRLVFYQSDKKTTDLPPISIIISAHDELENLKELIPLLLNQNYSQFEIVIIEDRSNDASYDFLLEESSRIERLEMVKVNSVPPGINSKKYALTLGIKRAKYEHCLFTDADCRPSSNLWLHEMAQGFHAGKAIVLGYSPYFKTKSLLNLFIRYETFYTAIQYLSFAMSGLPYMGVGRNMAYKKSLFLSNKGFNSHMSVTGGDDDLFINENATSNNVSIVITQDSKVFSKPKTTFREWITQKKRHLAVGKHYKLKFRLILGILAISQFLFWIFFILALNTDIDYKITIGLFFAKMLCTVLIFHLISKKLNEKLPLLLYPVLDFGYSIYYVCIGAIALFSKKNKWK